MRLREIEFSCAQTKDEAFSSSGCWEVYSRLLGSGPQALPCASAARIPASSSGSLKGCLVCRGWHCRVPSALPCLACREEELELDDDDYELLEEAGVHGVKVGETLLQ